MKLLKVISILTVLAMGCSAHLPIPKFGNKGHRSSYWERYGKVFYLDGAGNLGYGEDTVPRALRAGGFRGDVEIVVWTSYTGPLGDQMIRINARLRAEKLTKKIIEYRQRYPHTPLYIMGLSAGTGVAVWAVENLPAEMQVDTIVLLSSSLSTNYDMTKCLRHVKDRVYVLSSPHDKILKTFIPVTGTIDGSYFTQPAGIVGMYPSEKITREGMNLYKEKLVNIPWRPTFERLGNAGGHMDATSYSFMSHYIVPNLLKLRKYSHSEYDTSSSAESTGGSPGQVD